jgi:hypothetical protein
LAAQGQFNARAAQAMLANPQAFSSMAANPQAFLSLANNANALRALSANAAALNSLKGVNQFQALAANPSFAKAMLNANFATNLSNQ